MIRRRSASRIRSCLAVAALLPAGVFAGSGLSAAASTGWTTPTAIPTTHGVRAPVFATAPNGADLMVWTTPAPAGGDSLDARLRAPGRSTWTTVPTQLTHLHDTHALTLRASANGDFWLAFAVVRATGRSAVFVQRLDHRSGTWTKKTKPFSSADYSFDDPQLAVGGDGSVVIGALAVEVTDDAHRRAVVAHKASKTSSWQTTYLSPADQTAWPTVSVAAGQSGQLVVGWELVTSAPYEIWAAVRGRHGAGPWRSRLVARPTVPCDVSLPLSAHGTAALAFTNGSGFPTGQVVVAVDRLGTGLTWPVEPVATSDASSLVSGVPLVVVSNEGTPTVVYSRTETDGTITEMTSRVSGVWTTPVAVSRTSWVDSVPDALVQRTNGTAVVLYQQFTTGGSPTDLGLRLRTIVGAGVGPARIVSTYPVASDPWLGVTAAGGSVVAWQQGLYPDDDQVASETVMTAPQVVANAFSSERVRHTVVSGPARVGHRVVCRSGYWVEARGLAYHWMRNGHRIHGATHPTYLVAPGDAGHDLSCTLTASNASTQHTVLTGPLVHIS